MQDVKIKSDSDQSVSYIVTVDDHGFAIGCNCPAGQHSKPCKHLYRAEVRYAGLYEKSIMALMEKGLVKNWAQAHGMFDRKVELNKGDVNLTLQQLIMGALGDEHPLSTLPAYPRTRGARHKTCPHCKGCGHVAMDSPSAEKKRAKRKKAAPAVVLLADSELQPVPVH